VSSKCNQEPLNQIPSILEIFSQILLNFKCRSLSDFSFEIHFESEEVHMEKVVPSFKFLTTIFYFNLFELGKVLFRLVKV
jgi:hypothetical protein